jgi:hypothetical protein
VPHEEEDTCTWGGGYMHASGPFCARQQKEQRESKRKRGERGSFLFIYCYFSLLLGDAAGAENAIVLWPDTRLKALHRGERARARARERESERARERESERVREWESERARERESERVIERRRRRVYSYLMILEREAGFTFRCNDVYFHLYYI